MHQKGQFPSEWKKAYVVLVHTNGDKQVSRNYRPDSLLSICGEIFDRLLYNNLFELFIKNNLISSNQSGFKQGDFCIYQVLSITDEIYQSFDNNFEVRDISKAFDKVWHKGLIINLKKRGDLLTILTDFLKERKQRVFLNGQHSTWSNISTWAPQRLILGLLLFLIYINNLSGNLIPNPKLNPVFNKQAQEVIFKDYASSYNVEILKSFNLRLHLKDTESAIKIKLIDLLSELRGFKFVTILVLYIFLTIYNIFITQIQLKRAIAEMKLDTEQTMQLE